MVVEPGTLPWTLPAGPSARACCAGPDRWLGLAQTRPSTSSASTISLVALTSATHSDGVPAAPFGNYYRTVPGVPRASQPARLASVRSPVGGIMRQAAGGTACRGNGRRVCPNERLQGSFQP